MIIIWNLLLFGYIQDVTSEDPSPKTEISENGDNTPMSHEIYSPLPAVALFWERSSTHAYRDFRNDFDMVLDNLNLVLEKKNISLGIYSYVHFLTLNRAKPKLTVPFEYYLTLLFHFIRDPIKKRKKVGLLLDACTVTLSSVICLSYARSHTLLM